MTYLILKRLPPDNVHHEHFLKEMSIVKMRVIAHNDILAHIGVVAQGCVKKARTNWFNWISAQVSELSHRGAITPRNTHSGREVACCREWLRDTIELHWFVAVPLYRGFYHRGFTIWHRGGAHVERRKLFSWNRKTVSTQPRAEKAHVPQPTISLRFCNSPPVFVCCLSFDARALVYVYIWGGTVYEMHWESLYSSTLSASKAAALLFSIARIGVIACRGAYQ